MASSLGGSSSAYAGGSSSASVGGGSENARRSYQSVGGGSENARRSYLELATVEAQWLKDMTVGNIRAACAFMEDLLAMDKQRRWEQTEGVTEAYEVLTGLVNSQKSRFIEMFFNREDLRELIGREQEDLKVNKIKLGVVKSCIEKFKEALNKPEKASTENDPLAKNYFLIKQGLRKLKEFETKAEDLTRLIKMMEGRKAILKEKLSPTSPYFVRAAIVVGRIYAHFNNCRVSITSLVDSALYFEMALEVSQVKDLRRSLKNKGWYPEVPSHRMNPSKYLELC